MKTQNLKKYYLTDIYNDSIIKVVKLTKAEMLILNFAFGLNHSPYRYV
jgi:hypothetical protein